MWADYVRLLDYMNQYWTFKIARTILLSALVMLGIFLIRACLSLTKSSGGKVRNLYFRTWLWLVLIPLPFLGGLKIELGHVTIRGKVYFYLYQFIMVHPFLSRCYLAGVCVTAAVLIVRRVKLHLWILSLPQYQEPENIPRGRQWEKIDIRVS